MPPKKIKETQAENGDQPVAKRPARNAKKRLPDDEGNVSGGQWSLLTMMSSDPQQWCPLDIVQCIRLTSFCLTPVDSGSLQASNKRKKVSAEQVDPEAKQTKRKRTAPASKEIGSPAKEPKEKQKGKVFVYSVTSIWSVQLTTDLLITCQSEPLHKPLTNPKLLTNRNHLQIEATC